MLFTACMYIWCKCSSILVFIMTRNNIFMSGINVISKRLVLWILLCMCACSGMHLCFRKSGVNNAYLYNILVTLDFSSSWWIFMFRRHCGTSQLHWVIIASFDCFHDIKVSCIFMYAQFPLNLLLNLAGSWNWSSGDSY